MNDFPVYDPTDYQLQKYEGFPLEKIDLSKPVDPQVTAILIHNYNTLLVEIKGHKQQQRLDHEELDFLQKENTDLKVDLAKNNSNEIISWAEIFISLAGGFGINSIFSDPKTYTGYFLLGICFIILLIFRTPKFLEKAAHEKKGNKK